MHYGIILPDMPDGTSQTVVELGILAEHAGWDGVFFWDADWGYSPWVLLGGIATHTTTIHLGALLHPLPWRQPWLFARDTATLDQLSRGRLIVPIGLGAVTDAEWERGVTRVGMPVDRRIRATLMDEALPIVQRLWRGEAVSYNGQHYHLDTFALQIPPTRPHIPVWAVAKWNKRKTLERLKRCQGVLTADGWITPEELQNLRAWIHTNHPDPTHFAIVMEGDTRGQSPTEIHQTLTTWQTAGVTWWVETMWKHPHDHQSARTRIMMGPPTLL